jgi:hypothetical protein
MVMSGVDGTHKVLLFLYVLAVVLFVIPFSTEDPIIWITFRVAYMIIVVVSTVMVYKDVKLIERVLNVRSSPFLISLAVLLIYIITLPIYIYWRRKTIKVSLKTT